MQQILIGALLSFVAGNVTGALASIATFRASIAVLETEVRQLRLDFNSFRDSAHGTH